jgi:hypothetical protein
LTLGEQDTSTTSGSDKIIPLHALAEKGNAMQAPTSGIGRMTTSAGARP